MESEKSFPAIPITFSSQFLSFICPSPQRNNSSKILKLTELSRTHTREVLTFSAVASPEPDSVTLEDDSNDTTYGFGAQQQIVPPSLNVLKLPPKPFYILPAMTVAEPHLTRHDNRCSSQSPEPSDPPPISTPLMNVR